MTHRRALIFTASMASAFAGCARPLGERGECGADKCDDLQDEEVPDSPCDGILVDRSGSNHAKVAGRLNDPLAMLAFRAGDTCPTTFQDIMAKLRETDTDFVKCTGDPRAGISTHVVSETAQVMGQPTSYRTVTTRQCGNRPAESMMFSLFGITAGATSLPLGVEMMAFDDSAGVFNYYESDGARIEFFGSSIDMLDGPGDGEVRRCATCHTGGGMIMKELDTPWLHWEGHTSTPGARDLVDAHTDLGQKTSGAELADIVKATNVKWNKTRINVLEDVSSRSVRELLRPLFCSVEINIATGSNFGAPVVGSDLVQIPTNALLDDQIRPFGPGKTAIPVSFADYEVLLAANGQHIPGVPGVSDTFFDFAFIERSHADDNYVRQLKEAGIVDQDFIKDVLMVDFTRPVFSPDRCELLDFAPELETSELSPEALREGFIARLSDESPADDTAAAALLANLQQADDLEQHSAKVDEFLDACRALGKAAFLENALAITSLNRVKARQLPVLEFPATLPSDQLDMHPDARLHPATCQIVDRFVAP